MANEDSVTGSPQVTSQTSTRTTAQGVFDHLPTLPKALSLGTGDQPGLVLTTVPLNAKNYFTWSHRVQNALVAKGKAGFLTGRQIRPPEDTVECEAWIEVDALIRSWLINSISTELQSAFIFTPSANALWENLKERFGQSNGSLIYQLKRSISLLQQGDNSIAAYANKLQELWDELLTVDPSLLCTCASSQKAVERLERDLLIQFLTGLNDTYESARGQIVVMDPLPNMRKAYSMIVQIERQKEIHIAADQGVFVTENTASNRRYSDRRSLQQAEKRNSYCDYCKKKGHTRETCFKLHEVPSWYKELTDKKCSSVNAVESSGVAGGHSNLEAIIRAEVQRPWPTA